MSFISSAGIIPRFCNFSNCTSSLSRTLAQLWRQTERLTHLTYYGQYQSCFPLFALKLYSLSAIPLSRSGDDVLSKSSSSLPSWPIAQRHQTRDAVTDVISCELKAVKNQDLRRASSQTISSALQSASRPNAKDGATTGTGYTTRHSEASISLQPQ